MILCYTGLWCRVQGLHGQLRFVMPSHTTPKEDSTVNHVPAGSCLITELYKLQILVCGEWHAVWNGFETFGWWITKKLKKRQRLPVCKTLPSLNRGHELTELFFRYMPPNGYHLDVDNESVQHIYKQYGNDDTPCMCLSRDWLLAVTHSQWMSLHVMLM